MVDRRLLINLCPWDRMSCCSWTALRCRTIVLAFFPPFARAPWPGFKPVFDSSRPGCVHTGTSVFVVNDVVLRSFFLRFGFLSKIWCKQQRRSVLREGEAKYPNQERTKFSFLHRPGDRIELSAVVTALAINQLLMNLVRCRSVSTHWSSGSLHSCRSNPVLRCSLYVRSLSAIFFTLKTQPSVMS